jgi:hypothetical protein
MPWGTSISEVLTIYPNADLKKKTLPFDLHNLETDFSAIVKCYVESNGNSKSDTGIKSCNFYFYHDRLFCVMEYIPATVSFETIRTSMENIYGKFMDFPPEVNKLPLGVTLTLSGCSKTVTENQSIELDRLEFRGLIIGKRIEIMVRYSDPAVLKQVIEKGGL